jgi:hypothetical protein
MADKAVPVSHLPLFFFCRSASLSVTPRRLPLCELQVFLSYFTGLPVYRAMGYAEAPSNGRGGGGGSKPSERRQGEGGRGAGGKAQPRSGRRSSGGGSAAGAVGERKTLKGTIFELAAEGLERVLREARPEVGCSPISGRLATRHSLPCAPLEGGCTGASACREKRHERHERMGAGKIRAGEQVLSRVFGVPRLR